MSEYKLGKVYTAQDIEEARQFEGKEGIFSDTYLDIMKDEYTSKCVENTLTIIENTRYPFNAYQFFRPILEEEPRRMTLAELIEWITRGNGLFTVDCKVGIKSDYYWWGVIITGSFASELKKEVSECYRIRHFGTEECLIPTRDIFIKDCRGGKE